MKIKTLAIVVLSALSLSSTAALAETTTTWWDRSLCKGKLLTPACAVDAALLIKPFSWAGSYHASLDGAGATSSAVGFNIQLNDCDTSVAKKAAVAFLGTTIDANHTKVLALQSSAAV